VGRKPTPYTDTEPDTLLALEHLRPSAFPIRPCRKPTQKPTPEQQQSRHTRHPAPGTRHPAPGQSL